MASKRSVIERAFGLLGLRFPRLLKITAQSNLKRIKIVVAACVLHNWCILEDNADEDAFEEIIVQSLRHDISHGKPASSIVGRCRACGGGEYKEEHAAEFDWHTSVNRLLEVPTWQTVLFSFKFQSFPLKVQTHTL